MYVAHLKTRRGKGSLRYVMSLVIDVGIRTLRNAVLRNDTLNVHVP